MKHVAIPTASANREMAQPLHVVSIDEASRWLASTAAQNEDV
jgi:hypothetical protein